MSEQDHALPGLLAQWLELTKQEGDAIRADKWSEVARHQQGKKDLQPAISQVDPNIRSAPRFRAAVSELMVLERANSELLGERIGHARRMRDEVEQSSRNLRRVRQSYATAAPSNWHSYS